MSREPLPEPWHSALASKGIHSKRGLATKAGVSPQTAKRLIDGTGSPSAETVAAVADSLFNGDRGYVWELAGHERQDYGDWNLPPEASQLDPEQRAAVLAVVRAMLPPDVRRGDGSAERDAASTNRPGSGPVHTFPGSGKSSVIQEYEAARRGQKSRSAADADHQAAGEHPDPDGPEYGA